MNIPPEIRILREETGLPMMLPGVAEPGVDDMKVILDLIADEFLVEGQG